jgi:predicted Zn-dependent peptidase
VSTGATAYNETGDVTTYAGLNTENLKSALEVILKEHKRLVDEPVSDQELTRVKEFIKGRFAIGLETSDEQASFYGEQELLENKILTPEERLNKILAVTKEDIMEVAVDLFKPEKLNLAVIGPMDENSSGIKEVLHSWYNK